MTITSLSPVSIHADTVWSTDCFRYGDLAVALYYAGVPLPGETLTDDDLVAIAAAGVDHLGGMADVRRLCDAWDALNTSWLRGHAADDDYERSMRSLFVPYEADRLGRCIGHDISRFRP